MPAMETAVPVVGRCYLTKAKDETWHYAELIETRVNNEGNDRREYYVHYDGENRRLDEWVTVDRINLSSCKPSLQNELLASLDDRPLEERTRSKTRKIADLPLRREGRSDEFETSPANSMLEKEHQQFTRVKYIDCVRFGKYEIDTWYFSPYPNVVGRQHMLYVCEFCLKYMKYLRTFRFHLGDCHWQHPPGPRIYAKDKVAVYEVDGKREKLYCQNLCLLAKLFLDQKTLFFELNHFLFYILCEVDVKGAHLVGYFSKEKGSSEGYNLSCIMVLPPYQRKGYGKFLIQLSYELSKIEKSPGSPEKPLSDLGELSYRSYWTWAILEVLQQTKKCISVKHLSEVTGIAEDDVMYTLESLNLTEYTVGRHDLYLTPKMIEACVQSDAFRRPELTVDASCLQWQPKEDDEPMENSAVEAGSEEVQAGRS